MLTGSDFETLLRGALAAWACDDQISLKNEGLSAVIRRGGESVATVSHTVEPFGSVWRIDPHDGKREIIHTSIVATLRDLQALLCPDRLSGRVLFLREGLA